MSATMLLSLAFACYLVGATPLWEMATRSRHTRRPRQSSELRDGPFSDLPSDAFVLNEHFVDSIENTDNTQTATRTVDPDKKYRSNTQHYDLDRSTDTQGKTNLFSVYLLDKPIKWDRANLKKKEKPQKTNCNSTTPCNHHNYYFFSIVENSYNISNSTDLKSTNM